jgi:hypothetical protein
LYRSAKDFALKVQKKDRIPIMACLMCAVGHLITLAKPDKVFLCTFDADAPPKANQKFILLAKVFGDCGYKVQTADPYHGHSVWWMCKQ